MPAALADDGAFERTPSNHIPAPFVGATVKNAVDAVTALRLSLLLERV